MYKVRIVWHPQVRQLAPPMQKEHLRAKPEISIL
jgi:hypothetical protein